MLEKCFITDLPIKEINRRDNCIEYYLDINGEKNYFCYSKYKNYWKTGLEESSKNKTIYQIIEDSIRANKHILRGLVLNGKWIQEKDLYLTSRKIENIIIASDFPNTPEDIINNIFIGLCSLPKFYGDSIYFTQLIDTGWYKKYYLRNPEELNFYLKTLAAQKFINIEGYIANDVQSFHVSFDGLNHLVKLNTQGEHSYNCFVAMSFDKSEDYIFSEAIKPACEKTGYIPKRVDYEYLDSEQTINDGIIALLKKCKFCIADFTKQKDGVYFEAGYALGRNMKVIYTCRKDYFEKCHFDTNHFPHIVYETPEELKKKLIEKIEAWID